MKLLLIDDQHSAFVTLKKLLDGKFDLGFEYEWAETFELGEQAVELWKPDIALVDLNLGAFCLADKTISLLPRISNKCAVVGITGEEDQGNFLWARCLEAGAMNFLQKEHYFDPDPLTRKSLMHAIFNSAKVWKEFKRHESQKNP